MHAGHDGVLRRVSLRAQRVTADLLQRSRVTSSSFTLPVPAGAYAAIPVWGSRAQWFKAISAIVTSELGVALRAEWTPAKKWVSDEKFWEVCRVLASAADHETGRGVAMSHQKVAQLASAGDGAPMSAKTVQRVEAILERLGLLSLVVVGRDLTTEERSHLGTAQRGAASVRALTVSREAAVLAGVHLPSDPSLSKINSSKKKLTRRASARSTAAARPSARNESRRGEKAESRPRTAGFKRFAAKLDQATVIDGRVVGRFTQGASMEAFYRVLEQAGIDESRDVDEVLTQTLRWKPEYTLRNAMGWLRTRLDKIIHGRSNVPAPPPEMVGDPQLEQVWRESPDFRESWSRYQSQRAPQPAGASPAAAGDVVDVKPPVAPDPSDWKAVEAATRVRMEAAGDEAFAAGVAAARAAGRPAARAY